MNTLTETRYRDFVGRCRLESRAAARATLDFLIKFSERYADRLTLDERDLEQTSIGYRFAANEAFLWKAYAKDEKVEIMIKWRATIPEDDQPAFVARWKSLTGRELPTVGTGKTATLSFNAFLNEKLTPKIEELLDWLCASRGNVVS